MELEKIAKINFEETAYYQPISDKGIVFFDLDKNTAKLKFILTKEKAPLLISDKNVQGFAFLKSTGNKTNSGVLDLKIEDAMKGVVSIIVPPAFLKSATDTTCLGEIYLSLNDVNKTGQNDTVVLGTFRFDVKDSLVNKINSEIKIEYIRMFYDLRETLEKAVEALKQDIGNTQSVVDGVKEIISDALIKINTAKTDALAQIDVVKQDATNSIITERSGALNELVAKKNEVLTDYDVAAQKFEDTVNSANQSLDTKATTTTDELDNKIAEFNNNLNNNGFITPTNLDEKITNLNWQKYKLTTDDGLNLYDSELRIDFNNIDQITQLPIGTSYTVANVGLPTTVTSPNGWLTKYSRSTIQHLEFRPYNSKQVFVKRFYNSWSEWERIDISQSDTGWVTFNLINGALKNTAYSTTEDNGFLCAYRTITNGDINRKLLRINGTNLVPGQIIAQLPVNFAKTAQTFPVRVPTKYNGAYITIRPNGEVRFYLNGDTTNWIPGDYAYGQLEWTE